MAAMVSPLAPQAVQRSRGWRACSGVSQPTARAEPSPLRGRNPAHCAGGTQPERPQGTVDVQQPALAAFVGQLADVIENTHGMKGSVSHGLLSKTDHRPL
jgi:hypothetical protein